MLSESVGNMMTNRAEDVVKAKSAFRRLGYYPRPAENGIADRAIKRLEAQIIVLEKERDRLVATLDGLKQEIMQVEKNVTEAQQLVHEAKESLQMCLNK